MTPHLHLSHLPDTLLQRDLQSVLSTKVKKKQPHISYFEQKKPKVQARGEKDKSYNDSEWHKITN
jgi:hypothetical protein